MTWTNGFSQEIDSLSITYYVGHDCSYTINSKTLRGGCEKEEDIMYSKAKNSYKISSFVFKETFREWKGGFQPNLIEDSIRIVKRFNNHKIQAKTLDDFLKAIHSAKPDTIFPYTLEDVPISVYEDNPEKKGSATKAEIDSILKSSLIQLKCSSVIRIFSIDFNYEGKKYTLIKSENVYWTFYFQDKEGEERKQRFIYFDFDIFLSKNLPDKFSGMRILDSTLK